MTVFFSSKLMTRHTPSAESVPAVDDERSGRSRGNGRPDLTCRTFLTRASAAAASKLRQPPEHLCQLHLSGTASRSFGLGDHTRRSIGGVAWAEMAGRRAAPSGRSLPLLATLALAAVLALSAIQSCAAQLDGTAGRGLHSLTSELNLRTFGTHRSL